MLRTLPSRAQRDETKRSEQCSFAGFEEGGWAWGGEWMGVSQGRHVISRV